MYGRADPRHHHPMRADVVAGWLMSRDWPAGRRRRFRIGLVLYAAGLRQLAVRVAGLPR
jgi:hypothetical protein